LRALRLIPVVALALSSVAIGANAAGATTNHTDHHHGGGPYTCTGGNIAPGTYWSVTVTGVCYMPAGNVFIKRDLKVAPGALLDAVTPGDPSGTPLLPANVTIGGNVFVGAGAVLLLGCSPNISCPQAVGSDFVGGSVYAPGALGVVIHSTTIGGDVVYRGGGSGTGSDACAGTQHPWIDDPALANGEGPGVPIPVYSDLEDNFIGGSVKVIGLDSCWLGTLRNQIGGSAAFVNNTMADPDAMEVNNNLIQGNMLCSGNTPHVQFGDGGTASIVGGKGIDGCGFGVVLPNPAPEATTPILNEHITISASSLGWHWGERTESSDHETAFGTTLSGNVLSGGMNTAAYSGSGLVGTVAGISLSTTRPNGWTTFTALDTCTCSFDGKSGTVTIRAYGTTSPHGFTFGTFLVVTGPVASDPLSNLAGWGTFHTEHGSSDLKLKEHLGFA
jgi:Protein of unknown function (DUF3224)